MSWWHWRKSQEDVQSHSNTLYGNHFMAIHLVVWPADCARGNVPGSSKSVGFILWAPWMSLQFGNLSNSCWNSPAWIKVVDWLTDQPWVEPCWFLPLRGEPVQKCAPLSSYVFHHGILHDSKPFSPAFECGHSAVFEHGWTILYLNHS